MSEAPGVVVIRTYSKPHEAHLACSALRAAGIDATLADENKIRQVVTNLVGNAVAHTPAGTGVRIGVGTLDGRAVLEIADRGPGMTAEQAGRVFDRFYRTDRSRNRLGGANAGLGLAIARSLARAHGGEVELETSSGAGACFRLALPLLDAAEQP